MASISSLESADLVSHSVPGSEPSPTARSTLLLAPSCVHAWKTVVLTQHTSLETCENCEELRSAVTSISSSGDFPARISALQESAQAWMASEADYIAKCSALQRSVSRRSSSSKTSPELPNTFPVSVLTSLASAFAYELDACPRLKSERLTDEIESSCLLPTLSASSYGSNQGGAAGRVGPKRYSLLLLLRKGLLPTTTTKGNYNKAGLSSRSGDGLLTALSRLGATEPTREFLCWFMGFPSGWLISDLPETQSSRRKRAKRSNG